MNEYTINTIGFIVWVVTAYATSIHTGDWFNGSDWWTMFCIMVISPAVAIGTMLILDHFFGCKLLSELAETKAVNSVKANPEHIASLSKVEHNRYPS